MLFCPKNDSLYPSWSNHGISVCFMETICISVVGAFILIFGSIQLIIYKKYATLVSSFPFRRKKLYKVQIFVTFLLPVVTILRFFLEAFVLKNKVVYGYMVLELLVSLFIYPFSFALVYVERHYQLPSVPSKGHGLVLLLFWAMVFISENLSLINLKKAEWWFHLKTLSDKVELSLFATRYLSCLVLFVLGLRAPGILSTRDYLNLNQSNGISHEIICEQLQSSIMFSGLAIRCRKTENSGLKKEKPSCNPATLTDVRVLPKDKTRHV